MENKTYNILAIVRNNKLYIYKDKFLDNDESFVLPFEEENKNIISKYNIKGEFLASMFEYTTDGITFKPSIYDINEDSLGLKDENWIEGKDFDSLEVSPYFRKALNYLKKYLIKKYYVISRTLPSDETNYNNQSIFEGTVTEVEAYKIFNKELKNYNDIHLYDEMGEMMD